MIIGSTLGSMIPGLWGDSFLSISSILWSGAGAIAGIFVAFKLTH